MYTKKKRGLSPWIIGTAFFLACGALVLALRDILMPFIVAAVLAYILNPLVVKLRDKGVPRGAASMLVMLFALLLLLALLPVIPAAFREPFSGMAGYGITFNAVLFVLNALPVLPFDGGRIIDTFLPAKYSVQFQKTARYGTWVVLILLLTGILGYLILPLAAALSYTAYLPATLIAALFLR